MEQLGRVGKAVTLFEGDHIVTEGQLDLTLDNHAMLFPLVRKSPTGGWPVLRSGWEARDHQVQIAGYGTRQELVDKAKLTRIPRIQITQRAPFGRAYHVDALVVAAAASRWEEPPRVNIDADKRNPERNSALFRECLDIIIRAWTEDPFRYKGEFYEFPVPGWYETNKMFEPLDRRYHERDGEYVGMYVHPRPYQQPHPPVWLMSNAPPTFRMAGVRGLHVVGMNSATDNLRACWSAYQEGAKEHGATLRPGEGVGMCVVIYVAQTMEDAARDIRPAINKYYEFISGARPGGEWDRQSFLNAGETLSGDDRDADWFDFLCSKNMISGGTR